MKRYIPFYRTPITRRQISAVVRTLKTGWLTSGPACRAFEEKICEVTGARYAVAVSSCTAGLHLSLLASGIRKGDEVITTPFTFIASVEAILHAGATPVLADIDAESLNVSPTEIEKRVSRRTRAIMPVHIAGLPCDLTSIERIARKHDLRIIHDAAHAFGASHSGRQIGATPDITAFSFYATKNITTGEGGAVTTSSSRIAESLRTLSLHGMDKHAWKRYSKAGSWYYQVRRLGYKYNLSDLNAALGLAQIDDFDRMQCQRSEAAAQYDRELKNVEEITLPERNAESEHAWHLYIIRVDDSRLTIDRDELIDKLTADGVGCSVHFIPVFLHPYYKSELHLSIRDFPNANRAYRQVISLPMFPGIRKSEIRDVANRLQKIISKHRRR
jgi:dTDP-4-amino-4,6-dideoxygalactose transaminase